MDLTYSPEEHAFEEEVRAFLRDKLPKRLADKVRAGKRLTKQDMEEWHAILNERGWLAAGWPVEHGGTGWTAVQRHIFDVETALAGAPRVLPFGLAMLGPVLMKYGSEEQKRHYLPRILDGTDWWCQGYSEPGAGSDLAALKTTAIRDGDDYIVNGQKTWTTLGQYADWIFCLVRTDPQAAKRQQGISFLLIDMNTPGIEVRPIILLDGEHEVNEVFFTDVRVPIANRVGEENQGWTIAKYLLTHERTNIAGVGGSMAAYDWLLHIARTQKKAGRPLADDPYFAARLAKLEIDLENMKTTNLRVIAEAQAGGPAAESSMLKIRGTEIRQEISNLARRAVGPYAQPFVSDALDEGWNGEPIGPDYAAPVSSDYFNYRKLSIFGGSNEVQREIITKAILEL